MSIPIQNIYYLLSYSWNKLEEKAQVPVSLDDKAQIPDLLAKVLAGAVKLLLKRGLDRHYLETVEEIPGIRGKIDLAETLRRQSHRQLRLTCCFEELSPDIQINQIVSATLHRLLKLKPLDPSIREELRPLYRMLPPMTQLRLSSGIFKNIRLHRNNAFYKFVLHVCELIYECSLPAEKPGTWRFIDFTRDEKKMHSLFESFVRNFYRRHALTYKVWPETIKWQFDAKNAKDRDYIPGMHTDTTLMSDSEKIIIDTKYYQETMKGRYDKKRIISENLYQLFAYLLNQEDAGEPITLDARGVLLYPTIDQDYDLHYQYQSHGVSIQTINLNQDWKSVDSRLRAIVNLE